MTTRRNPNVEPYNPEAMPVDEGFDVTCVIGRVSLGPGGTMAPSVAAFQLIAEHDAPGIYSFPMRDGGTIQVTVEYIDPPEMHRHTDFNDLSA